MPLYNVIPGALPLVTVNERSSVNAHTFHPLAMAFAPVLSSAPNHREMNENRDNSVRNFIPQPGYLLSQLRLRVTHGIVYTVFLLKIRPF